MITDIVFDLSVLLVGLMLGRRWARWMPQRPEGGWCVYCGAPVLRGLEPCSKALLDECRRRAAKKAGGK